MKDYKRLTIRGGDLGFYGNVYNKCSNKDRPDIRKQFKEGKKSYEIEEYEYKEYTSEELSDIYKRLGELEDKIEQGRLIELPCKVGDTVYFVSKKDGIRQDKVSALSYRIDERGIYSLQVRDFQQYKWHTFKGVQDDCFCCITKAEAEARLRELKGEQKDV